MPRVLIVGAGLTGCTLAWRLAQEGVGLDPARAGRGARRPDPLRAHGRRALRAARLAHLPHRGQEVWELANSMTPFNDYRHRVDIVVEGKVLNWPILVSDIDAQSRTEEIKAELEERRGAGRRAARPGGQLRGVVPGADGARSSTSATSSPTPRSSGAGRRRRCRRSGRRGGCRCAGTTTRTCSPTPTRAGRRGPTATRT